METMYDLNNLYEKALQLEFLTAEEGLFLFKEAPLAELMQVADQLRKKQVPCHIYMFLEPLAIDQVR